MKFNSSTNEELNSVMSKLNNEKFHDIHVITHIDNPNGRTKFKDIRKISIGISKKDLMSYRSKKKSAFYNCFVIILRLKIQDAFKEFHVKVFNAGKLEIPGVQNEDTFQIILQQVIASDSPVQYLIDFRISRDINIPMKISKIPGFGSFGTYIDDVDFNNIDDHTWHEIGKLQIGRAHV